MGLDLSGEEASNGKPVGDFDLRVCEVKEKESKKTQDKYVYVKLAIVGKQFSKFTTTDMFMLEGKGAPVGLGRLAHFVDCLGVDRKFEYDELLNKMVSAKLKQDKEGYTKVDEYKIYTAPESEV